MGNTMPVPDKRMEKVIDLMKFTEAELRKLWAIFQKYDKDSTGTIDTREFYDLIQEKPSVFGDGIFRMIAVKREGELDFSEFVETLSTYCMFGTEDILKYCFYIFDMDKNGFIEEEELQALVELLHNNDVNVTIRHVIETMDLDHDGKVDFGEFKVLNDRHPQVLYPAFRLQGHMMMFTLGNDFWMDKRLSLYGMRVQERKRARKLRDEKRQRVKNAFLAEVREDMGPVQYYCNCAARRKAVKAAYLASKDDEERKARIEEKAKKAAELEALKSVDWKLKKREEEAKAIEDRKIARKDKKGEKLQQRLHGLKRPTMDLDRDRREAQRDRRSKKGGASSRKVGKPADEDKLPSFVESAPKRGRGSSKRVGIKR